MNTNMNMNMNMTKNMNTNMNSKLYGYFRSCKQVTFHVYQFLCFPVQVARSVS